MACCAPTPPRSFERLREANILLQEVLSGAHENMSEIESTLVTRVADFVAAMNDVAQKTGTANTQVEQHITAFQTVTANTLTDLRSWPANSMSMAARWRGGFADRSQQSPHRGLARRASGALETLINTLDSKSGESTSGWDGFPACSRSLSRMRMSGRARSPV